MSTKLFKVVAFNLLGVSLFIVGIFLGLLQPLFQNDASHLTYLLTFLMFVNIVLTIYDTSRPTKWIEDYLIYFEEEFLFIGLAGTLIGFTLLVLAVRAHGLGGGADQLDNLIKDFIGGMATAFNATLLGLIYYLWTRRSVYFMRDIEEEVPVDVVDSVLITDNKGLLIK